MYQKIKDKNVLYFGKKRNFELLTHCSFPQLNFLRKQALSH